MPKSSCAAMAAVLLFPAFMASAQCPPVWLAGGPSSNGPTAEAMTVWNRPGGPVLVVAGDVSRVGPATGVSAFNGERWEDLGSGIPDGTVDAVVADGATLYIGGQFLSVAGIQGNGAFVARLDSSGWATMPHYIAPVNVLAMHNGELVAGGEFPWLQPTPARWTGAGWSPLGGGVNDQVFALATFEGDLIAGGLFTTAGGQAALRVARWDGQAWHAMGAGFNGGVGALVVHEGVLFAQGGFTKSGTTNVETIAAWNGSAWVPVGSPPGKATSLISDPAGLLATFDAFSVGHPNPPISRWTGAAWEPYTTDTGALGPAFGPERGPMVRWQGDLLAHAPVLLRWNGTEWGFLGDQDRTLAGGLSTIIQFEGRVIGAGNLSQTGITAGLPSTERLVAWTGSRFEPFSGVPSSGGALSLLVDGGSLIAIGAHSWGPEVRTLAARWTGQAWEPFGAEVPATTIYDIGAGAIAGGRFYLTKGSSPIGVLPGGIVDATGPTLEPVGDIFLSHPKALIEHGGQLVVSAESADIGTPPASYTNPVLTWDGQAWHVLGDSPEFAGWASALASYNGLLIAGGDFETAIGRHISAWDGTQWTPLGEGLAGPPRSLAVIDGLLYAVGISGDCGAPLPCGGYATWDGTSWTTHLSEGAGPQRVVKHGDELFFTGNFPQRIAGFADAPFARRGPAEPNPCPADTTATTIPGTPGYGVPNGVVNNDDFFFYLSRFAAGSLEADLTSTALPADPCYGRPNGILNNDDFFYFLAAFAAGC